MRKHLKTTHRCRLFELKVSALIAQGQKFFAEVWDTLEKPFAENDLPQGKLIAEDQNSSSNKLVRLMEVKRKQLRIPHAGVWSAHPMVG